MCRATIIKVIEVNFMVRHWNNSISNIYTGCIKKNHPIYQNHIYAVIWAKCANNVGERKPSRFTWFPLGSNSTLEWTPTSVLVIMASGPQKAFCVLHFLQCESVITVQHDFHNRYGVHPSTSQNIRRWYEQFRETVCLCKGKSPGHPRVSDADLEQVHHCFTHSPQKSVCHNSSTCLQCLSGMCYINDYTWNHTDFSYCKLFIRVTMNNVWAFVTLF